MRRPLRKPDGTLYPLLKGLASAPTTLARSTQQERPCCRHVITIESRRCAQRPPRTAPVLKLVPSSRDAAGHALRACFWEKRRLTREEKRHRSWHQAERMRGDTSLAAVHAPSALRLNEFSALVAARLLHVGQRLRFPGAADNTCEVVPMPGGAFPPMVARRPPSAAAVCRPSSTRARRQSLALDVAGS